MLLADANIDHGPRFPILATDWSRSHGGKELSNEVIIENIQYENKDSVLGQCGNINSSAQRIMPTNAGRFKTIQDKTKAMAESGKLLFN